MQKSIGYRGKLPYTKTLNPKPQIMQYPTSYMTIKILPQIFILLHHFRVDRKLKAINFLQKLTLYISIIKDIKSNPEFQDLII